MPTASRQQFLCGCQRRHTTCTLPVSGLTVRLQSLTEAEAMAIEMAAYERDPITGDLRRDELGRLIRTEQSIRGARAQRVIATLVDDEGQRLLSDADLEQVQQLDMGDMDALDHAIARHLAPNRAVTEEAKKNSEETSETATA